MALRVNEEDHASWVRADESYTSNYNVQKAAHGSWDHCPQIRWKSVSYEEPSCDPFGQMICRSSISSYELFKIPSVNHL
ncbi:hypothetical protein CEXT_556261 [Caerostris extrusa]|uniref:Uncharacterized protein n=1 Tax=Caerostris extrusa TaxID=172846 RepID=A0AAV4WYU6_CAEEX|nr:hypothetical protein CEXT_556261 [Caerostris extrusa]